MKSELYVEFDGNQVCGTELLKKAKELWVSNGNKVKDIKALDMYYKPDEKKCYCVFNDGSDNISFDI